MSLHEAGSLLVAAAGIAFVMLADTTAMSRSLAARRGDHVDANREIRALGAANVAAGLFQGFPVSTSASRTAVAESSGSRTQLTGVVGAAAIVVILLVQNNLGRYLASSTLAAIIIAAALTLFDFESLRWLWKVRRSELWLSLVALLGVAVARRARGHPGRDRALARRTSYGGRGARTTRSSVGSRAPRATTTSTATLRRARSRASCCIASTRRSSSPTPSCSRSACSGRSTTAANATRWVIVAAEPITDVDTTGAEILSELLDDLDAQGVEVAFAELKGPVKDRLAQLRPLRADRRRPVLPDARHGDRRLPRGDGTTWVDWSDADPDDPHPAV